MIWTAFIMGLVGSLHCAGMCGPLTFLLPSDKTNQLRFISGRLLYNLGRIFTYALLGLVIGLIGQKSTLFVSRNVLSIILGSIILVAVQIPTKWVNDHKLYQITSRFVSKIKSGFKQNFKTNYYSGQLVFGVLNGLLPCGLVYAALAGAFIQLDILKGATYMAAFGAGTLPMMLSIALGSGWLKKYFSGSVKKIIPITYAFLAIWLIYRGVNTSGPTLHGAGATAIEECVTE
ncbi:sulfite exporter TauE/SafE family protein [Jiulongibacter sp. NS-SX5]|uniref:sulfite exporter TauE/SafE family protein n=1 Tax=Jiulongibacter sp. NS-SX5 TaxID=3463854 RepID=UPI004058027E